MRRRQGDRVQSGFRFWLESQGLAKDTVRNYVSGTNIWLTWCEENEVEGLKPDRDDIRAYLGYLLGGKARSNVELLKIALRRFFSFLIDTEQYEGSNPITNFPLKSRETEPAEPFTRDELARMMIACANHQERAVFLLLMGGGLRRGEIFGITRDDVNTETGIIHVNGKTGPHSIAPGMAVVDAVWSAMEFSNRLCPQGNPDCIWRMVKMIAKRANIRGRIYPHRFRHSFAVSYLEAGGKVEDLMHILGHKRLEQSLYYARAGAKRRALEAQATINIAETMLNLTPRTVMPKLLL